MIAAHAATAATHHVEAVDLIVPLSIWMEYADPTKQSKDENNVRGSSKESIIRKTTVTYGIVELLKRSKKLKDEEIRIDNFVVSISKKPSRSWDDIRGVGMISSGLSIVMGEPFYLSALIEGGNRNDDRIIGRCLEVELTSKKPSLANNLHNMPAEKESAAAQNNVGNNYLAGLNALAEVAEESNRCHLFARLLYELFTHEPFPDDALASNVDVASSPRERLQKRARKLPTRKNLMLKRAERDFDRAAVPFHTPCIVHMQEMGIPASICLMTQNLLEHSLRGSGRQSDDAYESLEIVGEDLHLLLLDPDRFLFDNENQNTDNMKLLYRKGKLYGRDKEETLITDAFCRVTRGKSEAFFIGGFSGSGKSMLVNSLNNIVNAVGGYTIQHKFDAMSRGKPLSGIISAFNQVCRMIKGASRPVIAKRLREEFGVDFGLLIQLLPSVSVLFPELVSSGVQEAAITMNARSVSFTLLRFVRVVSSPRHPVMLFLDDIQWADSTALDVVHTILSDTMGSFMFFVGTYRDNEVQLHHPIFDLMERLEISNVRKTRVSLAGLARVDLNTMISDALCLYPRICKSLSDIVFQKTKGNPFFVLEFMQSLKSRGLIQYNSHQKRWVWDEDILRGEEITDNVLHLLSTKMNGLPDDVQTLLKVLACFGISTDESVIGYLSESAGYSGIKNGLEGALSDGFIEKHSEGQLKFAHDKVLEAAYNLIPESDKKQFHYDVGKVLHSICSQKDAKDIIIITASQINHGKEWILKDKDLCIDIAWLNIKAGEKAIDVLDHKTAYSYLSTALSLLPEGHWESHYDLSLRLNFLLARAAISTFQYDEAESIIRKLVEKARCLNDQLPSYLLLIGIFPSQNNPDRAYDTCVSVLRLLGEPIPSSIEPEEASSMLADTLTMYKEVHNTEEWINKRLEDKKIQTIARIYNMFFITCYISKQKHIMVYHMCRAVQLSLKNGACQYTPLALVRFAGYCAMKEENLDSICLMAKNAMSMLKKFDVVDQHHHPIFYQNYYGRLAWRFEPLQVCADETRRAFQAALSLGQVDTAFLSAVHSIKTLIYSGARLKSTLKEIDYYLHLLETYKSEVAKSFLLIYRETVCLLIGNGKTTSEESAPCVGDLNEFGNKLREAALFHKAFQCYWIGHVQRCRYYSEKCAPILTPLAQLTTYLAKFYHGLTSLELVVKKRNSTEGNSVVRGAMSALKDAAAGSDWNFTNKLLLLEAEQQSRRQVHRKSVPMFNDSIKAAKKSGFIHEQGLACEKAAFYFMRIKKEEKAVEYFKQARECYESWGSAMKVDFIQKELDGLQKVRGGKSN